ncbi:hypothetical protein ST47_g10348 [Ascochyta rabiei]|uniref:Uncharacterized protein n=1 Tax=Didymella rabiei TaxID=5454 RepID=A0A162VPN3_DIDRA|nr:hypothetical protein ST47_g10348 [Ascochyta rabiei]
MILRLDFVQDRMLMTTSNVWIAKLDLHLASLHAENNSSASRTVLSCERTYKWDSRQQHAGTATRLWPARAQRQHGEYPQPTKYRETQPVLGESPRASRVSDLTTIAASQTILKLEALQNGLLEACQSESRSFYPAANPLGHAIPTM